MKRNRETGQLMVIVAIGMVVFLGMAALAIDLGRGYSERRNAQNGADAAALAGIRMVRMDPTVAGSAVYSAMQTIAAQNGNAQLLPANTSDLTQSGAVFVDASKNAVADVNSYTGSYTNIYGVRVRTRLTYSTLFAGMLGVGSMTSGGRATAMSLSTGNGALLPIAVHVKNTSGCTNFGWTDGDTVDVFDPGNIADFPGQFGWISFDGSGNTNNLASWIANGPPSDWKMFHNFKWSGVDMAPISGPDLSECVNGFYYDDQSNNHVDPTQPYKGGTPPTLVPHPENCDLSNGDCDIKGAEQSTWWHNDGGAPPTIRWMLGNTGVSPSSQIIDALPKVGQYALVFVYNKRDLGGSHAMYQIVGTAPFLITGIDLSGGYKHITGKYSPNAVVNATPTGGACNGNSCTVRLVPDP